MKMLYQIFAITGVNLKNIPSRLGSSAVIVLGIGGVVTVMVALLALAKGFEATMRDAGNQDRAVILRKGATEEISSSIDIEQYNILSNLPGIQRSGNLPLIAAEFNISLNLQRQGTGELVDAALRGVDEMSFKIRPEVNIIEGRTFDYGKRELIVGERLRDQVSGVEVGKTTSIRGVDWEVVGVFESSDSIFESEIWMDRTMLMEAFNRTNFKSVVAKLDSVEALKTLQDAVENDKRLTLDVVSEKQFLSSQSSTTAALISRIAAIIGTIMAIGAVFAALNSMYSAISTRAKEISVLRALGFVELPILVSVLIESLLLSLIGGVLGALIAFMAFNGITVSTRGNNDALVAFDFNVTFPIIALGILISLILGLVGGIIPATSAVRQSITEGLKAE